MNTLYKIQQMVKRTKRFAKALKVPGEQSALKASAMSFIEKGKRLTDDRLKVLKFADRDDWQAALNYVGTTT